MVRCLLPEYSDPAKARLIFQCDLKDGVSKLVNFKFDPLLGADVPELMVDGEDGGIRHTLQVTDDAFATENTKLVNFQTYYFSVVAYAYNDYQALRSGESELSENTVSGRT